MLPNVAFERMTTAAGTSAAWSADRFSFLAAPAVKKISPASGSASGETTVTITGTNLGGATAVSFGGTTVTSFVSDTATQIVLVSPAGVVYVKVTTAGGTSAASSAAKYTYTAVRAKTPVHAASVTDSALLAVLNEDADPLSPSFQKKTADLAGS
jgi:hypothetical protein